MKKIVGSIIFSLFVVACSTSTSSLSPDASGALVSVSASMGATTRISLSESDVDDSWVLQWVDGDALGAYSLGGDAVAFEPFEMLDFDLSNSLFQGELLEGYSRFVYPYLADATLEQDAFTIDLAAQSADMEDPFAAMSSTTYMISDEAVALQEGGAKITMNHLGAAFTVNIRFSSLDEEKYIYTFQSIEIGEAESTQGGVALPYAARVDLGAESPSDALSELSSGAIVVSVENSPEVVNYDPESSNTTYSINLNALPFTIGVGESIPLTWRLYRENRESGTVQETYKTHYISNNGDEQVEFGRATHTDLNYECDITGCYVWISVDVGFS